MCREFESLQARHMVDIAQLVSVPGCGPGGRGFESHYSPHYANDPTDCHRANKSLRTQKKQFILLQKPKGRDIIDCDNRVGVSPSGKAPDFDSGIRWFKSSYPCQMTH